MSHLLLPYRVSTGLLKCLLPAAVSPEASWSQDSPGVSQEYRFSSPTDAPSGPTFPENISSPLMTYHGGSQCGLGILGAPEILSGGLRGQTCLFFFNK